MHHRNEDALISLPSAHEQTDIQGLDKITTDIVHISLFCFNTPAVLLGIDSYKFWTVSSGILYCSM
jgi:hypothetical protein